MATINSIGLELTFLIGAVDLPLSKAMHLSRGAIIPLGRTIEGPLTVLANGAPVAEGRVRLQGEQIAVEIVNGGQTASRTASPSASIDPAT